MALNSKVKVPLPEKGVIVARRKGDVPRVYHVLETFRNEKGQPTNKRKLIGKLDEGSGMLVPNDAYYDYYDAAAAVEELPGEKPVTAPLAEFLSARILSGLGAAAAADLAALAESLNRTAETEGKTAVCVIGGKNVMDNCRLDKVVPLQ